MLWVGVQSVYIFGVPVFAYVFRYGLPPPSYQRTILSLLPVILVELPLLVFYVVLLFQELPIEDFTSFLTLSSTPYLYPYKLAM